MSLYTRLMGLTEPQLPVHVLMAALGELERGKVTAQQIIDALALSAGEQAELTTLVGKIVTPLETIAMGGYNVLTNIGSTYDAINQTLGLGFARIECAGITAFEFRVGMNRAGAAGTISWQLWDETNNAEAARIDDSSGANNKFVSVTQNLGSPLAAGVRIFRVRAKSTTAADDPVYYGANLLIRRIEILTADVLHQVLLCAERPLRWPFYTTEAALKARLGV